MRPQPPTALFEDLNAISFAPAEDMPDWIRDTFIDAASPVHNPDHAHLRFPDIGFLWTTVGNSKKGRRVIGKCETGSPQGITQWFGHVPDFIITLDADYCRECGDAEFLRVA